MIVRYAETKDLSTLVDIYNFYVKNHHSTFATSTATVDERREWFDRYRTTGPHRMLVAERENHLLGCAYSSTYRDHPAFRETVETSIYLAPHARGQGVGTSLYAALFESLKHEDLHLAVVGIALPNDASIRLHRRLGFEDVGVFKEYAKVKGQYYSSVWMQKALNVDGMKDVRKE